MIRNAQNQKELKHYYHDVENSGIALHKGLAMTEEDCLRRDVIKQLICNFKLDFAPMKNNIILISKSTLLKIYSYYSHYLKMD